MLLTFDASEHNLYISLYSAFLTSKKQAQNIDELSTALAVNAKFRDSGSPLRVIPPNAAEYDHEVLLQPKEENVSIDFTEKERVYLVQSIFPPHTLWDNKHLLLLAQLQDKLHIPPDKIESHE
jgi:hypothetical protein